MQCEYWPKCTKKCASKEIHRAVYARIAGWLQYKNIGNQWQEEQNRKDNRPLRLCVRETVENRSIRCDVCLAGLNCGECENY